MALAERMMNARFGDELVDHFTYVLASDGDLMEGISHEAISIAGHLKLSRLIVLYDDNDISIDGPLDLTESGDALGRFEAAGWDAVPIDGHDHAAIEKAIEAARQSDKPSLIACKTTIGYGSPNKQGTSGVHGAPLGDDEIALTRETLGWSSEPYDIPCDLLDNWRMAGRTMPQPAKLGKSVLPLNRRKPKTALSARSPGTYRKAWTALLMRSKNNLLTKSRAGQHANLPKKR